MAKQLSPTELKKQEKIKSDALAKEKENEKAIANEEKRLKEVKEKAEKKLQAEKEKEEKKEVEEFSQVLIDTLNAYPNIKEIHFHAEGWSFDKHKSRVYFRTVSREDILNSVKK